MLKRCINRFGDSHQNAETASRHHVIVKHYERSYFQTFQNSLLKIGLFIRSLFCPPKITKLGSTNITKTSCKEFHCSTRERACEDTSVDRSTGEFWAMCWDQKTKFWVNLEPCHFYRPWLIKYFVLKRYRIYANQQYLLKLSWLPKYAMFRPNRNQAKRCTNIKPCPKISSLCVQM